MAKHTDCIICGAPAGSGEHVFGAALGGRRTQKGIYCAEHDNGFSDLDNVLATQLRTLNGVIGIRPDHSEEPHLARAVDPTTGAERVIDARGAVGLAAAEIEEHGLDETGRNIVHARFPSQRARDEYIAELRKAGRDPVVEPLEHGTRYQLAPLRLEWRLGGERGLAAVARLALNCLAVVEPELARAPELRQLKDFIMAAAKNVKTALPVAACHALPRPGLPPAPFRFGHRILIACDAERSQLSALVEFFDTFSFEVQLAAIALSESRSHIVDIDPEADAPPNDRHITRVSGALINRDGEPPIDALRAALTTRQRRLLERIDAAHWGRVAASLLPAVNAARRQVDRLVSVRDALAKQRARILRLVGNIVSELCDELRATGTSDAEIALFQMLVEAADSESGVTPLTESVLTAAFEAVCAGVTCALDLGELDATELRALLEGRGARAVVIPILQHLIDQGFSDTRTSNAASAGGPA